MSQRYNYKPITRVGNLNTSLSATNIQTPITKNGITMLNNEDPLSYCLDSGVNKSFDHGVTGYLYGPSSRQCQVYMSERCANNWDGFCEVAANNKNSMYPNMGAMTSSYVKPYGNSVNGNVTNGEMLLHNTAQRRFCKVVGCDPYRVPFDPTNPASPYITDYGGSAECGMVCSVDPANIDNDPIMDRMLENPTVCMDTITNICNTSRKNGVDLTGTKIGRLCNVYYNS